MSNMTYTQQLRHPNWQRRRLEILSQADFACADCGCKDATLHVHHLRYRKGRMAWEYADDELQALCEACHKEHHDAEDCIRRLVAMSGAEVYGVLAGYLAGYVADADL